MFRFVIVLLACVASLLALAPSTNATPLPFQLAKRGLSKRDFNCNVDHVQCCDQLLSHKDATKSFGSLLNLPVGALGNVGLSCTPLLISAISQCKSSPVCCSQVSQSGAINAGCTPLSVI